MNETIGFFASEKKAVEKIIETAKYCWKDVWKENALSQWIEEFQEYKYDNFSGTRIQEEEVDMNMSLEGC